ncbi:MAG: type II secretion system inner membrane protein GspF [Deltaproteobacteria bacterium]|nr:type II secretion system inner membrane protein GspF [Deltaproteobacteria bacterium]
MAVFEYRGVHVQSGKSVKGFRDAENAKVLRGLLRKDGILLSHAEEDARGSASATRRELDLFAFFRRVTTSDIAVMTRQLATLTRAGVPLVDAISALVDQVEKEALVRVLTTVREDLKAGTSFAKCLERHGATFPALYVNMIAAGEASGTLEAVLERLADFMEGQARLRGKVTAALSYPVIMLVIGSVLVSFLMVSVVPKVVSIFENLGQELPWYTQVLIFVSGFVAGYWWLMLLMLGGSIWGFRRWHATPAGRLRWDAFTLSVPIFGRLNRLVAIARFSRTLATLLASGVQLLPAMGIVRNVIGNTLLEGVITRAIESIREGESIADPLRRSGELPPMVTHMIAIGEKSGQLEQMLENVSRAYESDVETQVAALTSMLEPLMIVALGGMVAFIALAILMPLMQMNQLVQ